ncbi:hypothetical protein F511_18386 [Dorcoceras hygrometricum]|uniref:Uncharacterized protein n=1 Tax=Dorcoceras hygrometricum TaxID=472368 RepID=A0A2Z7CBJ5_9LAMI|nr:hypothetical protein F511_18386 [Dorcoceras hygrometricum]
MHVATSSDHPRLPPFALHAPTTMAGAPSTGPPPGPAGPNQTSLGPNHGPHSSNQAFQVRRASRGAARATMVLPSTRPEFPLYGPPLADPRTTMNPLRSSHNPLSVPSTEAMQENSKTARCT